MNFIFNISLLFNNKQNTYAIMFFRSKINIHQFIQKHTYLQKFILRMNYEVIYNE